MGEFDADPAFDAYVGWLEIDLRRFGDHGGLCAWWGRDPDGGVAVAMVVVGDHDEDALGYEEGGFAMGKLFRGSGLGKSELANAVNLDGTVVLGWGHDYLPPIAGELVSIVADSTKI